MDRRARIIKRAATTVVIACIPALVVASIADQRGLAVIGVGLLAAVAALTLVVVGAVTTRGAAGSGRYDEARAAAVESGIERLVAAGADEGDLRDLVRATLDLAGSEPARPGS